MNRKERRRQAKTGTGSPSGPAFGADDALAFLSGRRPVPAPPPAAAPPPKTDTSTAVQFRALDALRAGRSVSAVTEAVRAAGAVADQAWNTARPVVEARKQAGFACAAGCSWCCYQQVAVAPAEAIAIARHVETTFTSEQRAGLTARIAALDDKARGLGLWSRARLKSPCVMLAENGACSIYEVRPLRCRGVYSRDAGQCQWVMENPDQVYGNPDRHATPGPYPVEPAKIMDTALTGLARACQEAGLDWQALELTAALRLILGHPEVTERYLGGEPVLAPARLPERDDGDPAHGPTTRGATGRPG
jgi:hypothetical protein